MDSSQTRIEALIRDLSPKNEDGICYGGKCHSGKTESRKENNAGVDLKATLEELSFHIGGYRLHNRFWENLAPALIGGGGVPGRALAKAIDGEFTKI